MSVRLVGALSSPNLMGCATFSGAGRGPPDPLFSRFPASSRDPTERCTRRCFSSSFISLLEQQCCLLDSFQPTSTPLCNLVLHFTSSEPAPVPSRDPSLESHPPSL